MCSHFPQHESRTERVRTINNICWTLVVKCITVLSVVVICRVGSTLSMLMTRSTSTMGLIDGKWSIPYCVKQAIGESGKIWLSQEMSLCVSDDTRNRRRGGGGRSRRVKVEAESKTKPKKSKVSKKGKRSKGKVINEGARRRNLGTTQRFIFLSFCFLPLEPRLKLRASSQVVFSIGFPAPETETETKVVETWMRAVF